MWWNLPAAALYEHAIGAGDGELARGGAMVVSTGAHTGRAPEGQVRGPRAGQRGPRLVGSEPGDRRGPLPRLGARLRDHLGPGAIYVIDAFAGAEPANRLSLRLVTESAWHALFARSLFIEPTDEQLAEHQPEAVILHAPTLAADPAADGTRASNFVVLHLTEQQILIGGTEYAGEIKKSIFTLMNDRLPNHGVLSMHCSANVGADGRVAVFFGLSGTGKTTLSTDSTRPLIGDDEHGWGDDGVFNIEGGCYAKVIRLSPEAEPEIYATTQMFGTVLENVVMDPVSRRLDLDDALEHREHPGGLSARVDPEHGPRRSAPGTRRTS